VPDVLAAERAPADELSGYRLDLGPVARDEHSGAGLVQRDEAGVSCRFVPVAIHDASDSEILEVDDPALSLVPSERDDDATLVIVAPFLPVVPPRPWLLEDLKYGMRERVDEVAYLAATVGERIDYGYAPADFRNGSTHVTAAEFQHDHFSHVLANLNSARLHLDAILGC
jgi:hypothetical protein